MTTASVVIPTFNRARLVSRAIDSALAQTYPCEVVLCDHGSTDDTPRVAAKYGDRIRYVRREQDRGPIACWYDGIEQATGEIVHINYDDDWMQPQFLEKTVPALTDDVGFVYTAVSIHNPESGAVADYGRDKPAFMAPMRDIVAYMLHNPFTLSPGCAIFRRKDALKNLLLEVPNATGRYGKGSGVGEDALLFLLTSLEYPNYAHVPESLACYLEHPGSITTDAVLSGRRNELAAAYANAKAYYLSRPGSFPPPTGLSKVLFSLRWHYRAGTLAQSAGNALRRLVRKPS